MIVVRQTRRIRTLDQVREFFDWHLHADQLASSPFGEAMAYAAECGVGLRVCLDDPAVVIDGVSEVPAIVHNRAAASRIDPETVQV